MNRTEKAAVIAQLTEKFNQYSFFYIADSSTLTVAKINALRRICFNKGIEIKVAKNTLIRKALEAVEDRTYSQNLYDTLHGTSALLFSDQSNLPAKVIKEFRKEDAKPALKAAYIDSDVYVGDDNLDALINLKSKADLLGELIGLLQSPMAGLLSQLQSGGTTIAGVLKTLSERE